MHHRSRTARALKPREGLCGTRNYPEFTIGLPVMEVPNITKEVEHGEEIGVDLDSWSVKIPRTNKSLQAKKVPEFLENLMKMGGLVEFYRKYQQFPWQRMKSQQYLLNWSNGNNRILSPIRMLLSDLNHPIGCRLLYRFWLERHQFCPAGHE